MKYLDAIGQKVVSRATAETLGELSGLVLIPSTIGITALQVGKGRKARFVDWASITGLGTAAVIVDDELHLREPRDEREKAMADGDLDPIGRLVLSTAGNIAGTVTDLEFDELQGELRVLHTTEGPVDSARLRVIGPYAVVIDPVVEGPPLPPLAAPGHNSSSMRTRPRAEHSSGTNSPVRVSSPHTRPTNHLPRRDP